MNSTLKLYGSIALLAILMLAGWGLVRWDNSRLGAAYDSGVQTERAVWVAKQDEANRKATAKANSDTLGSESTADQARSNAIAVTTASSAANQTSVEKINHAYEVEPLAPCNSAGVSRPLPAGVLEGLGEARSAALGQTTAAKGGLQPTKRSRSANASKGR